MSATRTMKTIVAAALRGGSVAVVGTALTLGVAQAQPHIGPPIHGPLPGNPYTWCPGMPMGGISSRDRGGPGLGVEWDMTRCHTWYGVRYGFGNVAPSVWDGPDPPPPEGLKPGPCGFPFMCSGTP